MIAWPASVGDLMLFNAPRNARPMPVRWPLLLAFPLLSLLAHAALQYTLAHPAISTVIPGAKTVAQALDKVSFHTDWRAQAEHGGYYQAIAAGLYRKAGIECELKAVVGSVFFSSDPGNVDTESHFNADMQLSPKILRQPDPQAFMRVFCSWEVAQKSNKWAGVNVSRFRNDEYDRLWRAAETEMDPVKRAALFIQMNDMVIKNVVVIPVAWRPRVAAIRRMSIERS